MLVYSVEVSSSVLLLHGVSLPLVHFVGLNLLCDSSLLLRLLLIQCRRAVEFLVHGCHGQILFSLLAGASRHKRRSAFLESCDLPAIGSLSSVYHGCLLPEHDLLSVENIDGVGICLRMHNLVVVVVRRIIMLQLLFTL